MPGMSERFELRFDEEMLEGIDKWRQEQRGMPSRAQAVRQLIENGLKAEQPQEPFRPSGAERLMLTMLADISQHLEIEREIAPEFVKSVLWGGQDWGMVWAYHGLFHAETPSAALVEEVARILEMWSILEASYKNLTAKQKEQVAKELDEVKLDVRFEGFDANNEGEHYTVAEFMVKELKRFDEFAKRDLNSHRPSLDGYRRMLPIYHRLVGHTRLSPAAIVEIFEARRHPDYRAKKPKN